MYRLGTGGALVLLATVAVVSVRTTAIGIAQSLDINVVRKISRSTHLPGGGGSPR
jgi:hypothetical protein